MHQLYKAFIHGFGRNGTPFKDEKWGLGAKWGLYRGFRDTGYLPFYFRDIGYYPFYFQGYGILGSTFSLLPGILKI